MKTVNITPDQITVNWVDNFDQLTAKPVRPRSWTGYGFLHAPSGALIEIHEGVMPMRLCYLDPITGEKFMADFTGAVTGQANDRARVDRAVLLTQAKGAVEVLRQTTVTPADIVIAIRWLSRAIDHAEGRNTRGELGITTALQLNDVKA